MITKAQAIEAREFVHIASGRTWRRNGRTQTWKTRPQEFRIPVKFGLYAYGNITQYHASEFEVKS